MNQNNWMPMENIDVLSKCSDWPTEWSLACLFNSTYMYCEVANGNWKSLISKTLERSFNSAKKVQHAQNPKILALRELHVCAVK